MIIIIIFTGDFFLWGELKKRVFTAPLPANLDELKEKITNAYAAIPDLWVKKAVRNMRRRVDWLVEAQGKHLSCKSEGKFRT